MPGNLPWHDSFAAPPLGHNWPRPLLGSWKSKTKKPSFKKLCSNLGPHRQKGTRQRHNACPAGRMSSSTFCEGENIPLKTWKKIEQNEKRFLNVFGTANAPGTQHFLWNHVRPIPPLKFTYTPPLKQPTGASLAISWKQHVYKMAWVTSKIQHNGGTSAGQIIVSMRWGGQPCLYKMHLLNNFHSIHAICVWGEIWWNGISSKQQNYL